MFRRVVPLGESVDLWFEDRLIPARPGETVAAALLAAGEIRLRDSAEGKDMRGPYCMIGNCFECLVEIDGRPNQQACQQRVCAGMRVRRQRARRGMDFGDDS